MKTLAMIALGLFPFLCMGQEVHVTRDKGVVSLAVWAQKPYELVAGQTKTPILTLQCIQKGKKIGHMLNFSPGGSLVDESPEAMVKGGAPTFVIKIKGIKYVTTWADSGDTVSYNYFAKREDERMQFIQSLLSAGSVSIQFTPFLTGVPVTSVFDLSQLREEMEKYPECAASVAK